MWGLLCVCVYIAGMGLNGDTRKIFVWIVHRVELFVASVEGKYCSSQSLTLNAWID